MSTTVKPVTQTALVEVKKLSTKLNQSPFMLEIGKDSKNAPIRITVKKQKAFLLETLFLSNLKKEAKII